MGGLNDYHNMKEASCRPGRRLRIYAGALAGLGAEAGLDTDPALHKGVAWHVRRIQPPDLRYVRNRDGDEARVTCMAIKEWNSTGSLKRCRKASRP